MEKSEHFKALMNVERIAKGTRINRFLNHPYKYISALLFRVLVYPKTRKERIVTANLYNGRKMTIALPASTDIYLTGGKSHDSEIRLAKYLIKNLEKDSHFLDIGAHFGYFTLMASGLVGDYGKVQSFEPSKLSYQLLAKNIADLKNTTSTQKAVSNSLESIVFYEFPNSHSEYNTTDITQFKDQEWIKDYKPNIIEIETTTIDEITKDGKFKPQIIKIDVEGAEHKVIRGGMSFFGAHSPQIVMEYLEPNRKNESHKNALELLLSLGYKTFIIKFDGEIEAITNIDEYLETEKLESDNIVFRKVQ